jgi:hypothetical protein
MEILAHVSAPSTKQDDDRAGRQLISFLNFQPLRITKCSTKPIEASSVVMDIEQSSISPICNISERRCQIEDRSTSSLCLNEYIQDNLAARPSTESRLIIMPSSAYRVSLTRLGMARQKWKIQNQLAAHTANSGVTTSTKYPVFQDNTQAAMAALLDGLSNSFESAQPSGGHSPPEVDEQGHCNEYPPCFENHFGLAANGILLSSNLARGSLSNISRIIKSPPPFDSIVQSEGTGTFMTKTLQKIISYRELVKTYQPVHQARVPGQFERGYWRIDTSTWGQQQQLEFWAFIGDFVGKGRAGFGTECVSGIRDDGFEDESLVNRLGIVRLYCWGELTRPLWLLCHFGCGGGLRSIETAWISAIDQSTVIQMP